MFSFSLSDPSAAESPEWQPPSKPPATVAPQEAIKKSRKKVTAIFPSLPIELDRFTLIGSPPADQGAPVL